LPSRTTVPHIPLAMADSSNSSRYSEQEMALILKRAAELQEGSDGRGITRSLAEINEIAAEVGIDASFVTEAVAELQRPTTRAGWLGAPTRFHAEQSVPSKLTSGEISGSRPGTLELGSTAKSIKSSMASNGAGAPDLACQF
jgi:hypothetical protein